MELIIRSRLVKLKDSAFEVCEGSAFMMSSLSTLVASIKFRILVKQLDDDEFDAFLSRLWRRNGKDAVLQLLRPNAENNSIPQNELRQITSTIITERDPPRRHPRPTAASILETPSQLIGVIASFLDLADYISFSSTNRKMFVDCNSPNRLTRLDLVQFPVIDPSFCLKDYPKLRFLRVNLHQMPSLNISRDPITLHCPDLECLWLHGDDGEFEGEAGAYSIDDFITDNTGRCRAIPTLMLERFLNENALNSQQLIRLLTEFPALTYLKLGGMVCDNHGDVDQFKSLCPRINNLSMMYVFGPTYAALLAALSPKLQTLSLDTCFRSSLQLPSNCDWSKLKALCLSAPTQNTMDAILDRAQNLNEMSFDPIRRVLDRQVIEIENAMERLIVDHSTVETFCIWTQGHLERICNSIHRGLSQIQKFEKEYLKMILVIDSTELTEIKGFPYLLSKILLTLSEADIMHWTVTLAPTKGRHFDPRTIEGIRSFIDSNDGIDVDLNEGHGVMFIQYHNYDESGDDYSDDYSDDDDEQLYN